MSSAVCMGSRVKRDGYSCGNREYRLHQGRTEVSEREPDNSAGGKLYTSMVTNHANKSIEMRVKHWLRASMFDKAFVSPSQVPEDEHEARDEEFLRALSSDIHPCEYSQKRKALTMGLSILDSWIAGWTIILSFIRIIVYRCFFHSL